MSSREYLFSGHSWHDVDSSQRHGMQKEIAELEGTRILGSSLDDLCDYFTAKFTVVVPEIDEGNAMADQREVEIDVSHDRTRSWSTPGPHFMRGTEVSLTVPYSGDKGLFYIRPSRFTPSPPKADVEGQNLVLRIQGLHLNSSDVGILLRRALAEINGYLDTLRHDAQPLNGQLRGLARQQLEARKAKLLADQNLLSGLGFPLKERPDAPRTYPASNVKRRIKPSLPPQSTSAFKPEPVLTTGDYEHILGVLGNMVQVMERNPSTFRSIDEESLRTHFLVHLNGHYEGQATGETFNGAGKTDILLRVEGRNIFIGECKFWGGPKKLIETLDQLLSYVCWRDTKVALLVFNRRKNFSAVLEAITPTIKVHTNFKRSLEVAGETVFRFVLAHRDDHAREMIVTVLAFDVPGEESDQ